MKVIVDNLAIEYLDQGEGPIIFLMHGWGNTLHYFDTLCAELAGYRIIRLDMPGFGASEQPPEPWSVERYTHFVVAFWKKLSIDPKILLGHSFGGRVILKGVGDGTFRPEKIVLVAAAGVANRRNIRTILYGMISKVGKLLLWPFPRSLYEKFRAQLYRRSGSDYLTLGGMSETFLKVIRENLTMSAAKIEIPALIIWGAQDLVTPLSQGEKLHELMKNSTLHVFSDAGHFVYRDEPKKVAALIKSFI